MRFLLAATLLARAAAAAPGGILSAPLQCLPGGPSYSVALGGAPLLTGAPPLAVFASGALQTAFRLLQARNLSGTDSLGAYAGVECTYALAAPAPAAPFFTAAILAYAAAAAAPAASLLRFTYTLPGGAAATNFSAGGRPGEHHATIGNFPSFTAAPLLQRSLTWADSFFPSQRDSVAYGMAGGPLLAFGEDVSGAATVLSPLDNFLTSSLGDATGPPGSGAYCAAGSTGCWSAGTASTVTSLPPGFSHSWLLLAGSRGVTDTAVAWGAVMRAYYGATSTSLDDPSLSGLGYQTDNGAQLCFGCPGQVLDKCLLEEKALLDAAQVPLQYLSFQNAWWKSGGESAPWCVGEWEAVPSKVPMGMKAFQQALALPLQLYAPYFCATSSYPNNFTMIRSDTTLPGCANFDFYDAAPSDSLRFYNYLFDLGESYGMTMFEPDFLNQNHNCQPLFISQVGAAESFFGGQAAAALARGIPIQWCFCTPYLLMWTLNAPAITNFRVSMDFYYGRSWDIGVTSLLVMALGKAPSKDTLWTTDNGAQATTRGGCDKTGCPPDHSTPAAELHTALALLSTGPVGFSDAPNETDASLIRRTCDSAGNLLQPSRPITAVDSTFSAAGAPAGGYVLATHTAIGGGSALPPALHIVVAHQLTADYALLLRDLWPAPGAGSGVWLSTAASVHALRGCAGGASAAACGVARVAVPAGAPPTLPLGLTLPAPPRGADAFAPVLALSARTCAPAPPSAAALALFGEVEKLAPVSVQRFLALACGVSSGGGGDATLALTLAGQAGEAVALTWVAWAGEAGTVHTGSHTFASAGQVDCAIEGAALTCGA